MADEAEILVDRLVPRRAAARKSAQLSAEQLVSSPPPSDREDVARTFGEPSKVRSPVKFTYGGKGRSRNSPRKPTGTLSRVPPVLARTKRVLRAAHPRALPSSLNRRHQSATAAAESFIHGSSLTPLSDSESESQPPSPTRAKQAPTKASSLHRKTTKKASPHVLRLTTPSVHQSNTVNTSGGGRKRPLSPTTSDTDPEIMSVLTPLSSPGPSNESPSKRPLSRTTSLSGSRAQKPSLATPSPSSSRTVPRRHPSRADISGEAQAGDDLLAFDATADNEWDLEKLGNLVWVRIDGRGEVVEEEKRNIDEDVFWWPAKVIVIHPTIPVRASLYGNSPHRSGNADSNVVQILSPSPCNILPMACRRILRFNESNFRHVARPRNIQASPKKKQKMDIEARWKTARDLMLKADEDANDGLPMMLSSYVGNSQSPSAQAAARARKAAGAISIPDTDAQVKSQKRSWRAPSCDPTYDMPGELILAKEKRGRSDYWPAQLLEYVKPTNPKQKPRYKALFYDGIVKLLESNMFYTTSDKGFRTCKLGQDKYNYGINEDRDEPDTSATVDRLIPGLQDEAALRVPSPPPYLPPPDDFAHGLSIGQQFNYVKPILTAVLEGQFEPAKERHDAFMRGAAARRNVCNSGYARGSLRPAEVEELLELITRWAHRRERRMELGISVSIPDRAVPPSLNGHSGADGNDQIMTDDQEILGPMTPVSRTSSLTDVDTPLSEAEAPPSSFIAAHIEAENELIAPDAPAEVSNDRVDMRGELSVAELHLAEPISISELSNMETDVDLKEIARDADLTSSGDAERSTGRPTFKDLSTVDQITYCHIILLHEAVLQLLLWRSGQRTTLDLLSPDEEQRLRNLAEEKAEETYWVHDIIRIKQAAEGQMLPSSHDKLHQTARPPASSLMRGTRSRPRK